MIYHTGHASDQLFERYGINATEFDWIESFLDVVDGRSLLLARQGNGRERRLLRVAGEPVIVVYEPASARFVTVLPPPGSG